jgi:hypothetical protein
MIPINDDLELESGEQVNETEAKPKLAKFTAASYLDRSSDEIPKVAQKMKE